MGECKCKNCKCKQRTPEAIIDILKKIALGVTPATMDKKDREAMDKFFGDTWTKDFGLEDE